MKTKIILTAIGLSIFGLNSNAQNWLTAGNIVGSGQFFGSNNNQPLLFKTNATDRMKLNQTVSYPVNSSSPTSVRDGFLLLGSANSNLASGGTLYSTKCAFSLLYLTLI